MKILLSNDDGIQAPGILALYEALKDLGEIVVVAPDSQQSAVSQAITLSRPIEATRFQHPAGFTGFAVKGTPTDSVKLGLTMLVEGARPDVVISGINHGPNMGISILYSGTVAAATEGVIQGIPSMAISIDTFESAHWNTAGAVAHSLVPLLHEHRLPLDTILNVNVPNVPIDEIKGYRVTRMGRSRFVDEFERIGTAEGSASYFVQGYLKNLEDHEDTDLLAVQNGFVSMTPLSLDITRHDALESLAKWRP